MKRRSIITPWAIVLMFTASLAVLTLTFLNAKDGSRSSQSDSWITIAVQILGATAVGLTGVAIGFAFRRDGTVNFTVAIAGPPRAGKTIFVNVLYRRLMEGDGPLRIRPDAKSAQRAFQILADVDRQQWPPATPDGILERYRGRIYLVRDGLASVRRSILGKPSRVDLEIGDAAGERWHDLSEKAKEEPSSAEFKQLQESTFFEYVAGSNALVYMISVEKLLDGTASTAVDELRSTFQLLRAVNGEDRRGLYRAPIALVISKCDLLTDWQLAILKDGLHRWVGWSTDMILNKDAAQYAQFESQVQVVSGVADILDRQCLAFDVYLVSSLDFIEMRTKRKDISAPETVMAWLIDRGMRI